MVIKIIKKINFYVMSKKTSRNFFLLVWEDKNYLCKNFRLYTKKNVYPP